jgi:hypothetical protein
VVFRKLTPGIRQRICRSRRGKRAAALPLCIVYGNCQAEAIRVLLERSAAFCGTYRTQPIPAVHTASRTNVEVLRRAVASASLIVSHPVRDGYHGFPVGSEEILEHAGTDCARLTIPALYYDGLYPYQVYVRDRAGAAPPAPLSIYHDLRFLHCAGMGWDIKTARSWLRDFEPSPDGIAQVAAQARDALLGYEAVFELDVRVARRLTGPEVLPDSFFTVNHPTNRGLNEVVAGIHAQLGMPYSPADGDEELLGRRRTPLESSVITALGLAASPRPEWTIDDRRFPLEDLLATHLTWYRAHRELVQSGLIEHASRLQVLGMPTKG